MPILKFHIVHLLYFFQVSDEIIKFFRNKIPSKALHYLSLISANSSLNMACKWPLIELWPCLWQDWWYHASHQLRVYQIRWGVLAPVQPTWHHLLAALPSSLPTCPASFTSASPAFPLSFPEDRCSTTLFSLSALVYLRRDAWLKQSFSQYPCWTCLGLESGKFSHPLLPRPDLCLNIREQSKENEPKTFQSLDVQCLGSPRFWIGKLWPPKRKRG